MLDTDTKRRIDTARDILVGKVPDPKSQVEQITIALIYKFMDDMDAESEELGGLRSFFAGDFARYSWAKLMRSGLGGHETLNLYAEAIARMPENPGVPALFRAIFKNAYLPYRDPETLRIFLKVIDEFSYDHSERLGDAFEYLLSVLGSQGDAGQFRTPRHIIDFMVKIVDPKKDEKVLDPACGTAGFLISSYKHILASNKDEKGESTLTPDEKGLLARNFTGYDISPDMVRLSLVNMYLHGFVDPHIYEYDTLTSQERWNEYADVILANPPFMSPKGGIRPHNRFSVQSKRSEVLFVDYMAEHLKPNGRAAIIVPEGIIFQSQGAYVQLRKMLVDDYLVAVVSLPAGVFNPYSGVKTSILILNKELAKRSSTIGFFKVENDGFGLGAQRRAIEANDLPMVESDIKKYLQSLKNFKMLDAFSSSLGQVVAKDKIEKDGNFSLSRERYQIDKASQANFPNVPLVEICDINSETKVPDKHYPHSFFNYIDISCIENESGKFLGAKKIFADEAPSRARRAVKQDDVLISTVRPNLKAFTLLADVPDRAIASTGLAVLRSKKDRLLPGFLIHALRHEKSVSQMVSMSGKGAYPSINQANIETIHIPLPPLEVQKEIVAEIEGYQKVIDGARAVLDNYQPFIPIESNWPIVSLAESTDFISGYAFKSDDMASSIANISYRPVVKIGNVGRDGQLDMSVAQYHAFDTYLDRYVLHVGDIVMAMTGATVGKVAVVKQDGLLLNQRVGVLRAKPAVLQNYILYLLFSSSFYNFCQRTAGGGAQGNIAPKDILQYKIPLPPLSTQHAIVSEIEAEQKLVDANRELIARFEKKIQAVLARVWGESNEQKEEQK